MRVPKIKLYMNFPISRKEGETKGKRIHIRLPPHALMHFKSSG